MDNTNSVSPNFVTIKSYYTLNTFCKSAKVVESTEDIPLEEFNTINDIGYFTDKLLYVALLYDGEEIARYFNCYSGILKEDKTGCKIVPSIQKDISDIMFNMCQI